MSQFQAVKGTRDFYPFEMKNRNYLFENWNKSAHLFAFEPYDACVLEHEELYVRKAGDEITEQLYNFKDKGGRALVLRPEVTPSLARMIASKERSLSFPLKWYSIAQCFRYERMTKGRRREHFQFNADIIGEQSYFAEVELLSLLLTSLKNLKFSNEDINVFISDRRILNHALKDMGVADELLAKVMVVIDKRDKISPQVLSKMLTELSLSAEQIQQINKVLETKTLGELKQKFGAIEPIIWLENIIAELTNAGFENYLKFDVSIVRGLSYYSATVFEVNTPTKSSRALCGGGRYDNLLSSLGGSSICAVGFGFGDVVIMDLLFELSKLPENNAPTDALIVPYSEEERSEAQKIANFLRLKGKRVILGNPNKKMKRTLKQADEQRVKKVILLFPDELKAGEIIIKDFLERTEIKVPLNDNNAILNSVS